METNQPTYRLTRRDHTGNPTRSEFPGEHALRQDAAKAGVAVSGFTSRDDAESAARAIEDASESPFAVEVVEARS